MRRLPINEMRRTLEAAQCLESFRTQWAQIQWYEFLFSMGKEARKAVYPRSGFLGPLPRVGGKKVQSKFFSCCRIALLFA